MRKCKYTKEQLETAVKSSKSLAGTMKHLGLNFKGGGGYFIIRKRINEWNIDISHFTGQGWKRERTFPTKHPIEYYLVDNCSITVQSHSLKKKLLREGIFERKCYGCNLTKWLDEDIPLELEHKNGVHTDNRLENLTLLCPNCHALTSTYCGKNIKNTGLVAESEYAEDSNSSVEIHKSSNLF